MNVDEITEYHFRTVPSAKPTVRKAIFSIKQVF
jgi:hypothetical protein